MKISQALFELYDGVRLPQITTRRFPQSQMLEWIHPLLGPAQARMDPLGHSAEGRVISSISIGNGPVRVLLWSQMHGDEATATMALLDILNFFARRGDHRVAALIRQSLSLIMIPMLNPDGAERFQRRTAQGIDMNRDALALETPEARILKKVRDDVQPGFAFNLHDQDPRYTAGQSKNVTALALLAPAIDEQRSDNSVRRNAKHVAACFAEAMQSLIPGHLARYDDTFEERAFGDNVQKWGTSTLLVESGGWKGDREKMFLRKLNFVGILASLHEIATGDFVKTSPDVYERLPLNGKKFYDMIFRNARIESSSTKLSTRVDVGINFEEKPDASGRFTLFGKVVDCGDLRTFGAFEEYELDGLLLDASLVALDNEMMREDFLDLMRKKQE